MQPITSQKARKRIEKDRDMIERQVADVEARRAASNASFDDMVKILRDQIADIDQAISNYDAAHPHSLQATIPIQEAV
jgi:hypothetical protein